MSEKELTLEEIESLTEDLAEKFFKRKSKQGRHIILGRYCAEKGWLVEDSKVLGVKLCSLDNCGSCKLFKKGFEELGKDFKYGEE